MGSEVEIQTKVGPGTSEFPVDVAQQSSLVAVKNCHFPLVPPPAFLLQQSTNSLFVCNPPLNFLHLRQATIHSVWSCTTLDTLVAGFPRLHSSKFLPPATHWPFPIHPVQRHSSAQIRP